MEQKTKEFRKWWKHQVKHPDKALLASIEDGRVDYWNWDKSKVTPD